MNKTYNEDMFTPNMKEVMVKALSLAESRDHAALMPEHVLYEMLKTKPVMDVLKAKGINLQDLEKDLGNHLETGLDDMKKTNGEDAISFSQPVVSVLRRAGAYLNAYEWKGDRQRKLDELITLLSLLSETHSWVYHFLTSTGLRRADVLHWRSYGSIAQSRVPVASVESPEHVSSLGNSGAMSPLEEGGSKASGTALREYATDLTAEARQGQIDPIIGREQEIDRAIEILSRRRKNNPIFVGEAGVGKTSIAEGIAQRIVDKKVPDYMADFNIYSVDITALMAGCKYRGDFEERLNNLLTEASKDQNSVLFFDEIHSLVTSGGLGAGVDISTALKPALARGKIRCMGATTQAEFRRFFEKDAALARRFQKIVVKEPTEDETLEILGGLKGKLEEHYKLEITPSVLATTVQLATRFLPSRRNPDKSIDILDEACATIVHDNSKGASFKAVEAHHIENVISRAAGIPVKSSAADKEALRDLEATLKRQIFGQDEAVDLVVNAVKVAQAGLRNKKKPIASFMFAGPTGVGKTELTNRLGEALSMPVVRLDMSEYSERHAVSKLVGAPAGYVGHEGGGLLTEKIEQNPYSILLLDEIEKAHPDMSNMLLQVLDYGRLTDSHGRTVDFRNTIIIMTSNVGAAELSKPSFGFMPGARDGDAEKGVHNPAIKQAFSPEFLNRLSAVIQFSSLPKDAVFSVIDKTIVELSQNLKEAGVEISLSLMAKEYLAKVGYDPEMGARPIERAVYEHVCKPLADEILFGRLSEGGAVEINIDENSGEIALEFKREAEMVPA